MIGHEVDDDFQTGIMRTVYQVLKLLHPFLGFYGQVRVYVIIVFNGVWGTGFSFYNGRMIGRNSV